MAIYGLLDQLDASINKLGAIEAQVTRRIVARPTRTISYAPRRVAFGSPDNWWETLKQWVTVGIPSWIGPLSDLYKELVQAGIITVSQAEQNLSREELIALIREMQPKPWYERPSALWILCGIASAGVLTAAVAYYLAKKPKKGR